MDRRRDRRRPPRQRRRLLRAAVRADPLGRGPRAADAAVVGPGRSGPGHARWSRTEPRTQSVWRRQLVRSGGRRRRGRQTRQRCRAERGRCDAQGIGPGWPDAARCRRPLARRCRRQRLRSERAVAGDRQLRIRQADAAGAQCQARGWRSRDPREPDDEGRGRGRSGGQPPSCRRPRTECRWYRRGGAGRHSRHRGVGRRARGRSRHWQRTGRRLAAERLRPHREGRCRAYRVDRGATSEGPPQHRVVQPESPGDGLRHRAAAESRRIRAAACQPRDGLRCRRLVGQGQRARHRAGPDPRRRRCRDRQLCRPGDRLRPVRRCHRPGSLPAARGHGRRHRQGAGRRCRSRVRSAPDSVRAESRRPFPPRPDDRQQVEAHRYRSGGGAGRRQTVAETAGGAVPGPLQRQHRCRRAQGCAGPDPRRATLRGADRPPDPGPHRRSAAHHRQRAYRGEARRPRRRW